MAIDTASRQKAIRLRANSQARVAQIRADTTLNADQKTALIARENVRHNAELRPLQAEHDEEVAVERSRLERAVFGSDDDPDAYRNALAQAGRIEKQDEAMRVLRRAERVGDQTMQKALLTISAEKGWREVETTYMERHPQVQSNLVKLREFESAVNDVGERIFSPFRALRSAELPAGDDRINRLAEEGDKIVTHAAEIAAAAAPYDPERTSGGATMGSA